MFVKTAPVRLFADELHNYAIRSPRRLEPGLAVVSVCLGLPADFRECDYPLVDALGVPFEYSASVEELTVSGTGEYSWSWLHGQAPLDDDVCSVVFFDSPVVPGAPSDRYSILADVGVEPYDRGIEWFNPTNFLLDVAELKALGVEVVPRVSPWHQVRIDERNAEAIALRGNTSYWPSVFGNQ